MKRINCPCGREVVLSHLPLKPFIECSICGRRLPVHADESEFLDRCPKCGRFMEKDVVNIHVAVCSGAPAATA